MQQQERDLIADLFGRLQQFETQPRDRRGRAPDRAARRPPAGVALSARADRAGAGAGAEGGAGRALPSSRPRRAAAPARRASSASAPRSDRGGLAGRPGCSAAAESGDPAALRRRAPQAGRRRLPALGPDHGGGRRRRRAAVRRHPQHDGPQSGAVRLGRGRLQPRRCCRQFAADAAGSAQRRPIWRRTTVRPTTTIRSMTTIGDDSGFDRSNDDI